MRKQRKLFLALSLFAAFTAKSQNVEIAQGPYQASWEGTSKWECPEWFKDAKFGIWAHWGPQCEPEDGDWYARYMYAKGSSQYNYHVSHYGNPSTFGLKDLCNEWKAENWNPDKLVSLYKSVGARYFFALGNHHDNMDLWNSPYQEWNSVNIGPKKDLLKGWSDACKKNNLPLGVSIHAARAWLWLELSQLFDGNLTKEDGKGKWWEGLDPQELYAQRHTPSVNFTDPNAMFGYWDWYPNTGWSVPSQSYKMKFQNRVLECINNYDPDMIYFDDTVLPFYGCDNQIGLNILAHYYNTRVKRTGQADVVVTGKILQDWMKESIMWDVERGIPDRKQDKYWQTCTCLGDWHYSQNVYKNNTYKSAQQVINMLVDVVSKNGNLLMSVPLKGDGTLDDKEEDILAGIKKWMDQNSRSIYNTRPWKVFGEGPLAEATNPMSGPGFNEQNNYTSRDVRYVIKSAKTEQESDTLFATIMKWPTERVFQFKNLGLSSQNCCGEVESIELLGCKAPINYSLDVDGLTVQMPEVQTNQIAPVFALTFKKNSYHPLSLSETIDFCKLQMKLSKVGVNTGNVDPLVFNALAKAVDVAGESVNSDSITQASAIDTLLKAWDTYKKHRTIQPSLPAEGGADCTLFYLNETSNFARTDATKGLRWGTPKNWTVENYTIPTPNDGVKNGLDNWPGFENLYLGVWDDRTSASCELHNARIFQKIHLPAGQWFFGTSFNANSNLDNAYMFVADELQSTSDLPQKALSFCKINELPLNKMSGLSFVLDNEQDVYIGFQADLTGGAQQQEFRAKEVLLLRYNVVSSDTLTKLAAMARQTMQYVQQNYVDRYPITEATVLNDAIESAEKMSSDASLSDIMTSVTVLSKALDNFLVCIMDDVTSLYLKNPSFEETSSASSYVAPKGWKVDCNCAWWGVNNGGGQDNAPATDGTYIFGVWDSKNTARATISQNINIPEGRYRLAVDMHASNRVGSERVGSQRVFAGNNQGLFRDQVENPGNNDEFPMQTIYVDFIQTEAGMVNIGVTTGDAPTETWFKIDNFRLYKVQVPTNISTGIQNKKSINTSSKIYQLNGVEVHSTKSGGVYIIGNKKRLIK